MKRAIALTVLSAVFLGACGGAASAPLEPDAGASATTHTTVAASPPTTEPMALTTSTTSPAQASGFPIKVTDNLGEVTIDAKPIAIVSLSPASTEILFAVGAGEQVLAVDSLSNYPASAPLDPELSAWTPNIEAIIGMSPDLVVISGDTGDLVAGLNAAGISVLTHFAPATLDDVYAQIEQVGAVTGNIGGAAELVAEMQADISDIVAGVPQYEDPPSYYHELDDTLYSVTSQTFIGQLYGLLGLANVADPADSDGSAYGYPQLSAEYLVDADPDFIFLADTICCAASTDSIADRPGWETLTAVQAGRIVELDDDVASRWGPRIVDLLRTVAAAMSAAEVSNG